MIPLQGAVFRPPSEADSLILQVTLGCSYNDCTFCGMYQEKPFRVRKLEDLQAEIRLAAQQMPWVQKVFLADGDALVAPAKLLAAVCDLLQESFPKLRRISIYASPQALQIRTVAEMRDLRERGLSLYYLGVESGDDETLTLLNKGVDADEMIRVGKLPGEAGVKLSTMILLNSGGPDLSQQHVLGSARVINAIQPKFVSTLVMTPVENTPLWEDAQSGKWVEMHPVELAAELRTFLAALDLKGTIFRSNHASNWLALAGTLPKNQAELVATLDAVLEHPEHAQFRPRWARGL